MGEIRALTLKQPWAWAVVHAGKRVENRSWKPPSQTRWFAIHAGARSGWDDDGEFSPLVRASWEDWCAAQPPGTAPHTAAGLFRQSSLITFSAVVALAELDSVHHYNDCAGATGKRCSPWAAADQFHWVLRRVHVLSTPVPCAGARQLWPIPPDVAAAIRAQLPAMSEMETR